MRLHRVVTNAPGAGVFLLADFTIQFWNREEASSSKRPLSFAWKAFTLIQSSRISEGAHTKDRVLRFTVERRRVSKRRRGCRGKKPLEGIRTSHHRYRRTG